MPQQPNNLQIPLQTKRCQWVRKTNDAFRICKKAFCAHAHTFDAGGMVEGAESPGCEPGLRPHGVPLPRLLNFSPDQKHVIFPCFESCHALFALLGRQFLVISGNTWQNPLFHLLPCILRSVGQGLFRKCMSDYRNRVLCHANDLEKKIRTGFTQWLQAERRRAPLSACCLAYATGRRGSQGLAGAWAVRTEKQLEEKKKYQDSMVPAAKRAKSLYFPEALWHPGA